MFMTLPSFQITVEVEYNDDLILQGTSEQIKNLIEVLLNNNMTTFTVRPTPKPVQTIHPTFSALGIS